MQVGDVYKIIVGHPPVIGYSPQHLSNFWEYLTSIGVEDPAAVILARPNLLGLDAETNLKKIVE